MKDRLASHSLRRLETLALAAGLVLVAVAACWPLLLATLQADDLCRSVRLSHNSIIGCVQQDYLTFTGRWVSFGLEYAALSFAQGSPAYGLVLGGIAVVYVGAITFLTGAVCPNISLTRRLLVSVLLLEIYWVGLPSTKDSCYWLCGSIEYQLSLAIMMLNIGLTIVAAGRMSAGKSYWLPWLLAMLNAVVASGMHELYALMLCLVMLAGSWIAWKWHTAGKYLWLVVSGFALVGFLFSFMAPGNGVRSESIEHSGEIWATLRVAVSAMLQSIPDWVFNFRLAVATLLVLGILPEQVKSIRWLNDDRRKLLQWVVPLLWIVCLGGAFLGPAWGTGHVVASRTLSAAFMIFLIGWFLNWMLLVAWLQSKSIELFVLHPIARAAIVLLLALSLVLTGNSRRVLREMTGPIPDYAEAKTEWQEVLRKAREANHQDVVLPAIADPPTLIGFSDITTDPENWINKCAAEYYGVRTVRVETK